MQKHLSTPKCLPETLCVWILVMPTQLLFPSCPLFDVFRPKNDSYTSATDVKKKVEVEILSKDLISMQSLNVQRGKIIPPIIPYARILFPESLSLSSPNSMTALVSVFSKVLAEGSERKTRLNEKSLQAAGCMLLLPEDFCQTLCTQMKSLFFSLLFLILLQLLLLLSAKSTLLWCYIFCWWCRKMPLLFLPLLFSRQPLYHPEGERVLSMSLSVSASSSASVSHSFSFCRKMNESMTRRGEREKNRRAKC